MASGGRLDWLLRPIAHRGLYDPARGIIENSASAVRAAIDAGYAIEVDLQAAREGEPVVFHDATLDRLTDRKGRLDELDLAELRNTALKGGNDRILALQDLLDLVAGRVPLLLEIKAPRTNHGRFVKNIAHALAAYSGSVAVMSFDPAIVSAFRQLAPKLPRGLIAETFADRAHWPGLSPLRRFAMRHLLTVAVARPHFIAYDINALPAAAPAVARRLGLPLLTWTVRCETDLDRASGCADAIIFEHLRPAIRESKLEP